MPVHNSEIASQLRQIADLLEIKQANRFRVRAYRNAARSIETWGVNLREMADQEQDLEQIPGVGKDIAQKIGQLITTGKIVQLEELKDELEPGLIEMLQLEGLGPKRVAQLYHELGIANQQELEQAAKQKKIRELNGFGPKLEEKILKRLKNKSAQDERVLRSDALEVVEPLLSYLDDLAETKQVEEAGSTRRKKETVGDVDILVSSSQGEVVCQKFVDYEDVSRVISQGETRSSVVLRTGLQVDLRVVPAKSFGAALMYFTGSKAHNIELRKIAINQGFKLNEYGLFSADDQQKRIGGKSEKKLYQKLGLAYVEPELRENRGEVEAALENDLPDLLTLTDIKGDLQLHTKQSDGNNSLEEMAEAAIDLGYEYMAVTDHSQHLTVANGLDAKHYKKQFEQIDHLNQKYQKQGFRILKAAEVDILADGKLDLDDQILAEFDLVLGSIHSHFNFSQEKQTKRIIKAMSHPQFNILAHPTGRLINKRSGYQINLDKIIQAALGYNCILEINAQPNRLDLDDVAAKAAKDRGVKFSLGTDAHSLRELKFMRFGVDQARRGWLQPADVINCLGVKELLQLVDKENN